MDTRQKAPESRRATIARSTRHLALWTGAWLLATALMTFGSLFLWPDNTVLNGLAIVMNLATGWGMILATVRYLKAQDEMERKVFLDAAAVTLGVAVVAGIAFQFYGSLPFAAMKLEIPHLILLMGITFLVTTVAGWRRLR
ncbi:hypothetical protein [Microbulbifer sp.]|uniref:hypothetical protein n=1 Tax=Microbulbifer sp. TaxID=1908541 RepID=UPI003F39C345